MFEIDKYLQEIDDLKVYIHWYITMIYLNGRLDESKVSKHKIIYNNLEEFKNSDKFEHWKKIHNL